MRRIERLISKTTMVPLMLIVIGYVLFGAGSALAAPGPPPPPVPAENLFTEYLVGGGMAAYGSYRIWKAKRMAKKTKHQG
jgi:hypothetical protein